MGRIEGLNETLTGECDSVSGVQWRSGGSEKDWEVHFNPRDLRHKLGVYTWLISSLVSC